MLGRYEGVEFRDRSLRTRAVDVACSLNVSSNPAVLTRSLALVFSRLTLLL